MIKKSVFIKSIQDPIDCPAPRLSEVFLMGRSNVGKSSFINALTNKKKLALFSKTPGKTTTVNYFLLNDSFYLVDSPGYGYSKRNKTFKQSVFPMINNFLQNNYFVKIIFQIIDFKVGPTKMDLDIYHNLREYNLPVFLILNKKDKVLKNQVINQMQRIKKEFGAFEENIPMFLLSCKNKDGLNEIVNLIYDKINT
ncbi:MAG: putative GTP-binding protein EngB [Candidatus Phytoplasma pruni]